MTPILKGFKPITEEELKYLFNNIKLNYSSGYNDITENTIRHCQDEIFKPILQIINAQILQVKLPDKIQVAKIFQKFKNSNKQDPNNYQPISNLPIISTLLERSTYNQIIRHL